MHQRSSVLYLILLTPIVGVWGFLVHRSPRITTSNQAAPRRLEENVAGPLYVNEKVR